MTSRHVISCMFTVTGTLTLPIPVAHAGPPAPRRIESLNASWEFRQGPCPAQHDTAVTRPDWQTVNLPHTWNARDGQDGGGDYYRGPGCYRCAFSLPEYVRDKRVFLRCGAANTVADVYVNAHHVGQHRGGFAAFCFEITPYVRFGGVNQLAIQVDNRHFDDVPPWSADFTFFGGIYRDLELLITHPICISPLDHASPGVYLLQTEVSAQRAEIDVVTLLDSGASQDRPVAVVATIWDADRKVLAQEASLVWVPAGARERVAQRLTLERPHLWQGRDDPYLYEVTVVLRVDGKRVDAVNQPLGLRTVRVDPVQGLLLNGQPFALHGVNRHQDWQDHGWAIGRAEHDRDFALICEMGCTGVRLAHYQHDDSAYALCDRLGLIVWAEIPLVNRIADTPAFRANCRQQLTELIRQNFNHPSILFWGVHNEVTAPWEPGPDPTDLVRELAALAKQEDPSRLTVCAATVPDDHPANWQTDLVAFNRYFGWYHGLPDEFGAWADKMHAAHPDRPIGISEYGAGASIQHHEHPAQRPQHDGAWHPEAWQAFVHERHWLAIKARPYLWGSFVWNMFDFASDGRAEGDAPGRNDKGLVTYDRQTRKDAFFWYKANWSNEPFVHIVGGRQVQRSERRCDIRVYSNRSEVTLFVNGQSRGPGTRDGGAAFQWSKVELVPGVNVIRAEAGDGAARVSDTRRWVICPQAGDPPAVLPSQRDSQ